MSLSDEGNYQGATTVDASTSPSIATKGCPVVAIEVVSSSSLSVKVAVAGISGDFRKVRAYRLDGASTESAVDPDAATGTLAAQDLILVPTLGQAFVRVERAAGSGTVRFRAYPTDALSSFLLMKLIDGGITASIGAVVIAGVATETKQDSQITLETSIRDAVQLLDDVVKTDDAAFTPATDKVAMIGAEFDDTAPDSVDEGDAGALRMSARRELYSQLRDAAGNERGANVTAANELNVLDSNTGAIKTAVEVMDDWDESDRAKVNLIAGQAGITGGAGAAAANTPRVISADDSLDVAGSETIATGQASVGTSETAVVAARNNRHAVLIVNHGTTAVYLGPIGLTTSTGVLLPGVAGASAVIPTQGAIFGVVAAGSQTVSYIELY